MRAIRTRSKRIFERDKAYLRYLGYPVEEIPDDDPWASDAQLTAGYHVPRLLQPPRGALQARRGVRRCSPSPRTPGTTPPGPARAACPGRAETRAQCGGHARAGASTHRGGRETAFEPLLSAVLAHRTVRFDCVDRRGGLLTAHRAAVGAWARATAWYFAGWDTDGVPGAARLSRVQSPRSR
ncbi:hypothetical protein QJS66_04455 [Kocuria rhizophila]|nr:hypothetical protein QJS66_04455 [Kocuria rhizophila]